MEYTLASTGLNRNKVKEVVSDALIKAQKNYKKNPVLAYNYLGELSSVLTKWSSVNKAAVARSQNAQDLYKAVDNLNVKFFA